MESSAWIARYYLYTSWFSLSVSMFKEEGHKVELIDLRLLRGWKDYDTLLKKQRPEFLGVTMHTSEFDIAVECCRRAKNFDS